MFVVFSLSRGNLGALGDLGDLGDRGDRRRGGVVGFGFGFGVERLRQGFVIVPGALAIGEGELAFWLSVGGAFGSSMVIFGMAGRRATLESTRPTMGQTRKGPFGRVPMMMGSHLDSGNNQLGYPTSESERDRRATLDLNLLWEF